MLAYVFWHRPYPHIDGKTYEDAITRFQRDLSRYPPPGLISAASFRIEAVPWLGDQPGYEDWCLLEGSWAMDPLNAYAVSGDTQATHDHVAAQMAVGHGGLYAHIRGDDSSAARSTVFWLTRPRGIQWRAVLQAVHAGTRNARSWRRQMVLGPTSEFAIEVAEGDHVEIPAGWTSRRVGRVRLTQ
jgi:hypothetical protein